MLVWSLASNSWSAPTLGLSYETWNRLMALPLLVLLSASILGVVREWRSLVRLALVVTSVGLAAGLSGSVLEFWVAGGIRTGTGEFAAGVALHRVYR